MAVLLAACAVPAWAQTAAPAMPADTGVRVDPTPPAPDKSLYTLFNPTPDSALRGFAADRPAKVLSPITVDAGHVQIESDFFSYTHVNGDGVSTRLYTAFDPTVKVGVTNWMDLELQFGGMNWTNTVASGTNQRLYSANGAGDLYLRSKINLFGNEGGVAMALIPYVKFPTASPGLGNRQYEGGLAAPISIPLPWDLTLTVQPEVDVLKNAYNTGYHGNFVQIVNLGKPITEKLTVYAEFYSSIANDHGTPAVYTADVAAAYMLTDRLQLDVGANFGLNKASPNVQAYAGIATRF